MDKLYLNQQRILEFNKKLKKRIFISAVIVLIIVSALFKIFYPGDFYFNFSEKELSYEVWTRYKSYSFSSMTKEQKEQYAKEYMLDKYGVDVNAEYKVPTGTSFSRLYPYVKISSKNSDDPFEIYHVFFKGNGKICDDYYLYNIQDFVTEKVKQVTEDLPYECVVITHTYNYSPYYPTYRMKRLAKNEQMKFLKLKKTITRIDYIFSTDCVEHKDELCKMLEDKTSFMNADGNLYFVDGDIHKVEFSSLKPEMLLAFY